MPVSSILNPKNDVAFKKLFGTEPNADLTLELLNYALSAHLENPLVELTFPDTKQLPRNHGDKSSHLDVFCKDERGHRYIVEMQVEPDQHFSQRAQYYASKSFFAQLEEGQQYEQLAHVIFLAFTNFALFPEKKAYKSNHAILDLVTHENDLEHLRFTFVDLAGFSKQTQNKPIAQLNQEEKLYLFLRKAEKLTPKEFEMLTRNNPTLQKLTKQLQRQYWSKQELAFYDAEEKRQRDTLSLTTQAEARGLQQGMQKGLQQGMQKGEERGRQALLKQLVAQGTLTQRQADALLQQPLKVFS